MEAEARDWPDRSLAEVAAALRAGAVTSEAVTAACLDRARAAQPELRAFISLEPERALADARRADRALAQGRPAGPLHGVPLAHKDIFLRGSLPATAGSILHRSPPAAETATVLARLEGAGAISLGTLNLSEFAAYSTGENPHHGDCANPHDPARIAGGSSSGSAAAVAAGLCFGSLGSDTGGSIRNPAAFCGVTGLKPTYGLVSRRGLIPRAWSLDTVGVLARSAADCALLLSAIAGPDPLDPSASARPPPDYARAVAGPPPPFRLGFVRSALADNLDPEVAQALAVAFDDLAALADEASDATLPDMASSFGLADAVMKPEAAAIHGRWMKARPEAYGPAVFARNEAGFHVPATRYVEALAARGPVTAAFVQEAFAGSDILCLPTAPVPAPTFAAVRTGDPAAVDRLVAGLTRFVRPFNYLGLPALAVPCGLTGEGLPIGMQLVGRPFGEARLLALAHRYQERTRWHLVRASSC